jgi:hypothetical protein
MQTMKVELQWHVYGDLPIQNANKVAARMVNVEVHLVDIVVRDVEGQLLEYVYLIRKPLQNNTQVEYCRALRDSQRHESGLDLLLDDRITFIEDIAKRKKGAKRASASNVQLFFRRVQHSRSTRYEGHDLGKCFRIA